MMLFYLDYMSNLTVTLFCESLTQYTSLQLVYKSSCPKMFLGKALLETCSKFTGEHPCRSATSIKLLCNFTEITLWHTYSPVNLLYIFRTSFPKNTSGWLLLGLVSAEKTLAKIFSLIETIVPPLC